MGAHVLKPNKGPIFAQKPMNNNCSSSAAQELASVTASRYDCDVTESYVIFFRPSFIRIERCSYVGQCPQT